MDENGLSEAQGRDLSEVHKQMDDSNLCRRGYKGPLMPHGQEYMEWKVS